MVLGHSETQHLPEKPSVGGGGFSRLPQKRLPAPAILYSALQRPWWRFLISYPMRSSYLAHHHTHPMVMVCRVSTKYGAGILKAGVCRAAGGLGLLELGA